MRKNKSESEIKEVSLDEAIKIIVLKKQENINIFNEKLKKKRKWLLDNVEVLLEITEHNSSSNCTDNNPKDYSFYRTDDICVRCQLLIIKNSNYNDYWIPEINLNYEEDKKFNEQEISNRIKNI